MVHPAEEESLEDGLRDVALIEISAMDCVHVALSSSLSRDRNIGCFFFLGGGGGGEGACDRLTTSHSVFRECGRDVCQAFTRLEHVHQDHVKHTIINLVSIFALFQTNWNSHPCKKDQAFTREPISSTIPLLNEVSIS